jgi:uncharacterized protein with FMN-binding domain
MTEIVIVSHTDTPGFVNRVRNATIPALIQAQNADIQVLSGATDTSRGIITAVRDAITQASR